jgi:hypothetical protein
MTVVIQGTQIAARLCETARHANARCGPRRRRNGERSLSLAKAVKVQSGWHPIGELPAAL